MRAIFFGLTWACIIIIGYLTYNFGQLRQQKPAPPTPLGFIYSKALIAENYALIKADINMNSSEVFENSQKILKKSPLDHNSFVHMNRVSESKALFQNAIMLNNEALRRNSRSRRALSLGLQQALRGGDLSSAVEKTDILFRLDVNNRNTYVSLLSTLFEAADSRPFISEQLENGPVWGYRILLHLIQTSTAETINNRREALNVFIPKMDTPLEKSKLISGYTSRLIDYEYFEEALEFWTRHQDPQLLETNTGTGLINPTFQRTLLTKPFDWKSFQHKASYSELKYAGGLYASYRSEKVATIAEQYFIWPENHDATVNFDVQYQYQENQGQFSVQFFCLKPDKLIAEIAFDKTAKKTGPQRRIIPAQPQSCPMAHLKIIGRPGIFSQPISMTLNTLDISFKSKDFPLLTGEEE